MSTSQIKKVHKPWGYELIWIHTAKYVGKVLHIDEGHSLSKQYHQVKDEAILVQSGILTLELETTQKSFDFDDIDNVEAYTCIMEPGESFHIPPGLIHRMIAEHGPVDLIEVSTPEIMDIVRLQDKYGRI
jgi:mannose-6-phosphate isomerase